MTKIDSHAESVVSQLPSSFWDCTGADVQTVAALYERIGAEMETTSTEMETTIAPFVALVASAADEDAMTLGTMLTPDEMRAVEDIARRMAEADSATYALKMWEFRAGVPGAEEPTVPKLRKGLPGEIFAGRTSA